MKKTILISLAAALLLPATSLLAGTVIFQQNFDSVTEGLNQTVIGNMTAINGTDVDVVGGKLWNACKAPESGNCVDLGGSGGKPYGQLESTAAITLTAGYTYDLSFDLIGHLYAPSSTTEVSFGPYSQTFVLSSGDYTSGIVNEIFTVPTMESSHLLLVYEDTAGSSNDNGALVDNIVITQTPTVAGGSPLATPEPSSLLLLGSGFVTMAGFARRKISGINR